MSQLFYKVRRLFRQRTASALVLLLLTSLFICYNFTSISKPQISSLLSSSKDSPTIGNPDDETVPFYKSNSNNHDTSNAAARLVSNNDNGDATAKNNVNIPFSSNDYKTNERLALAHHFFDQIFDVYLKGKPTVEPLTRYKSENRIYHAGYDGPSEVVFTEEYLNSFLDISPQEIASLQKSHQVVTDKLKVQIPEQLYSGNGIVYVGGGKFNWLALLSLKSLRSLGSQLPVEIVIPSVDEYEADLCERVFPALNAKCILLPRALGDKVVKQFSFKGYQYKALALIVSSFENVLLLDSDNIPIHSPDHLFVNEPFTSKGLITWPDFWRRATSPNYYKIANIQVTNERVRWGYDDRDKANEDQQEIPYHDFKGTIPDPTCESGQLMISKKTHAYDLFLALYYNLYGPDYYYPLFSQGSDGEGDKETFLAATVALDNTYYQVNKFLNAFGHFDSQHQFVGTGMGQYDPVEDYNYQINKKRQEKQSEELNQELEFSTKEPRILFVHANFPKLNPVSLKEAGSLIDPHTKERSRLYGTGMAKRVGYDFELVQWRNMHFLICELKIGIKAFKGLNAADVCEEIIAQLEHLEETVKDNERD
ncbi:hypothetical protein WICPIJ_001260 [Wickerhamomyces pijperi]|uniref:Glycosyltransferase family 71 protein n=1 Tax=Wickerhamomyces pijperi TaxID=599730 RepID=A0A9P8QBZ7_WICPI|nr:hypothetical protein WICPIJ_001260 [Wickerhamomyces pijperi]